MRLSKHSGLAALACLALAAVTLWSFGWSLPGLGIPLALLLALLADGIFRPSSSLLYPTVTHGPRDSRRVALSFDDGPDAVVTPVVLDALAQHGAHATFFTIGRELAAQPELARRMVAEGHELGNHSWQHSYAQNFFGMRWQQAEIERGAKPIAAATGRSQPQPLYRPPIGLKCPPLAWAAAKLELTVVAWSLHGRDTGRLDAEYIAARVLKKIRPGDIVLLHDGHDRAGRSRPACALLVPLILQGLQQQGLQCVTVSELLNRTAVTGCKTADA